MKSKMQVQPSIARNALSVALMAVVSLCVVATRAQTASRFLGTVTAISGTTLTVKTDAGEVHQVDVPAEAALKRIAPGEKDLSKAETIQFGDLATGDRVLVKLDPNAPAGTSQASQIIAVKAADVAQKQQKDREDWQRNGVNGLVKSVDPAAGVIVLTSGVGAAAKSITVHTTKTTILKRYAPASVRFDQAQPAPIDSIHAGDQLRARGEKNADGTEITAVEAVSGSFRNISGTIASLDASSSTLVVKDLATKKQITIHITPDAQIRKLSDRMAQMLAIRLKGGSSGSGGAAGGGWNGGAQPASGAAGSAAHSAAGAGQGGGGAQWSGQGGGDPQQMLSRAPTIQLADLNKGDAVMLVSTDGTTDVTAITLLAGVEPLLQAPAATQNLLNNWSMGSGAPDTGAQ
ncbi:MAG: hypothetical protein ABSD67_07925 [Terracidiphilus sp.]|jgi:hypothetical protein